MTLEFKCGDPAALAGYLYDECDAAERAVIETHLALCVSCVAELAALGATRTALASWTPPEMALGFRITSTRDTAEQNAGRATVLTPPQWWRRPLPAWAQAAAAVLIFAAGAGMGMRTASRVEPASPGGRDSLVPAVATVSASDLAALERRLRGEMQTPRVLDQPLPQPAAASEEAVVQRLRALLAESEQRQERELALRLTQVVRDLDAQRLMDLRRIERTFGQMEGVTRPELAEQRQMINYLIQRTGMQRAPQ